jgi:LmbE family N-acetylglucosaminyl deacetylase
VAGRTILVIVAHPDDCELTCAGTVARWVREGDRASLLIAADGARGGKVIGADQEAVIRERRAEQEEAAATIGFDEVRFLGFPDGDLEDDAVLRGALVRAVRQVRPDCVIVMDPLTVIFRDSYINHRDHRMLGMATLDALYPQASNAGYFPEQIEHGLQPHKVPELLLVQSDQPNFWVDISETIEIRFDALRLHRSQMKLWPDAGEAIISAQRAYAAMIGTEHGMPYAEAFRRIVVNPLS